MARTVPLVEYRILGPMEVRDGDHIVEIPGVKEKALLALLIVELGTVVSIDRVIFELWGDDAPPSAVGTVRTLVSRLRRHLGKDTVLAQRPGYRLDAEPGDVDSHLFEDLADQLSGQRGDIRNTESLAGRAMGLWRGDALPEFQTFHFADSEARRLEHRRLSVMEALFDSRLRLGRHADLITSLSEAIDQHPLHEPFYATMMTALYRSGRTAEALNLYADLASLLGEELGIDPSQEVRRIERSIVVEDGSLDLDTPETPNNLTTTLSSFVGRDRELEALEEAIPNRRLLTLTGPGGSGKSRLAVEIAHRLLAKFPDGVWRIELAPLREPASVVPAIAGALGDPASHSADPVGSLTDALGAGRVLLVLDNCEHLLDPITQVANAILQRCPRVTILATSREPLGIAGESLWLVPPLQLPDADTSSQEQRKAEAVRLFSSRASAAVADFEPGDEEMSHVFDICRMVDGLPLALELAAARVSSMTVRTIADRLMTDLEVLSAPRGSVAARHQTMTAALDWSFRLLGPETAEVFCKLAVFRGGWTVEDARSVLGEESFDLIAELVDRSLVERLQGRHLEYRLLEPIREYASERLHQLPDSRAVSDRHALTYLALARRADEALRGHDQVEWLRLLEEEHDNLRRAIAHCLDVNEAGTALQLVGSLGLFWFMGGHWRSRGTG